MRSSCKSWRAHFVQLYGLLLLVAVVGKGIRGLPFFVGGDILSGVAVQWSLLGLECVIGLGLLMQPGRSWSCLGGIGASGAFLGAHLRHFVVSGAYDCNCFGSLSVSRWQSAIIAGVGLVACVSRAWEIGVARLKIGGTACAGLLVAIAAIVGLGATGRGEKEMQKWVEDRAVPAPAVVIVGSVHCDECMRVAARSRDVIPVNVTRVLAVLEGEEEVGGVAAAGWRCMAVPVETWWAFVGRRPPAVWYVSRDGHVRALADIGEFGLVHK